MNWQPIKTAPKDGTFILTCVVGFIPSVTRWESLSDKLITKALACNVPISKWRVREAAEFDDDDDWFSDWAGTIYDPQYWQPLPEAPEITK